MEDATVDIVMAVYDGDEFLREALDSILAQSYGRWRAIVVDDGSTDATSGILGAYKLKDGRFEIKAQSNHGLSHALNTGLGMSQARYVARLDADDLMHPERLALQVSHLEQHPEVGIVGSAAEMIDSRGRWLCTYAMPTTDAELRRALARFNPFFHSSVMFRRELVDMVGGYREDFVAAQDYDLWMRMSSICGLANLSRPLITQRVHNDRISERSRRRQALEHILTQWRGVRRGAYPPTSMVHMARPSAFLLMPDFAAEYADAVSRKRNQGGVVRKIA